MDATLDDLRDLLTVRTFNALRGHQHVHGEDGLRLSDREVLRVRNFGRVCLRDLRHAQAAWRQAHPLTWDEGHPLHQEP